MFEDSVDGWERRPNGDVEVFPVVGWSVASSPGLVPLRLEFATDAGRIEFVQLVLPLDEALQLAKTIRLRARRAAQTEKKSHR